MRLTFFLLFITFVILSFFSNQSDGGLIGLKEAAKILYELTKNRVKAYFDKKDKNKCERIKDKSMVSASLDHSPIKPFGYPTLNIYQERKGFTMITPRGSLSYWSGTFEPVKVGKEDFYFVGDKKELVKFCECFQKYDVIGTKLMDDGEWKEGGNLQIQLENIQSWSGGSADPNLFEMIFKMGLDRILKEINPRDIIKEKIGIARSFKDFVNFKKDDLLGNLKTLKYNWNRIRKYIPEKPDVLKKIDTILDGVDQIAKAGGTTPEELYKDLVALLKGDKVKKTDLNTWYQRGNLDQKGTIIGVITMYAKPENKLRTTYTFSKSRVTMNDIGDALKQLFKK